MPASASSKSTDRNNSYIIEIQDYLLDKSLADSFSLAARTQKRRKVFKASFESERDIILRNDDVFGGMHLAPIK